MSLCNLLTFTDTFLRASDKKTTAKISQYATLLFRFSAVGGTLNPKSINQRKSFSFEGIDVSLLNLKLLSICADLYISFCYNSKDMFPNKTNGRQKYRIRAIKHLIM